MGELAYYDGEIGCRNKIKIGLDDRAVFFGDGVYEVMIGGGRGVYQLDRHLSRLKRNADALSIAYPARIEEIIGELVRKSGADTYSVYVQLSRHGEKRVHSPCSTDRSHLLITLDKADIRPLKEPITVTVEADIRYRMCNIKTLNLLPSVMASDRAQRAGCEEAVFLREGYVTEGAKSNVFILKDNILKTHPKTCDILPGITRENIIGAAKEAGIAVSEEKFTLDDLLSADEAMISSTTKLIRRIGSVEGGLVGCRNKPLFDRLCDILYRDFAESVM